MRPAIFPSIDTSFETTIESKYGVTTTSKGNMTFRGTVKVEIRVPVVLPGTSPPPSL
jgi:hypothetical protein